MSHVIVLPQDPSAAPPPGMTPSAVPDPAQDDAMGDLFSAGGNMGMSNDSVSLKHYIRVI